MQKLPNTAEHYHVPKVFNQNNRDAFVSELSEFIQGLPTTAPKPPYVSVAISYDYWRNNGAFYGKVVTKEIIALRETLQSSNAPYQVVSHCVDHNNRVGYTLTLRMRPFELTDMMVRPR